GSSQADALYVGRLSILQSTRRGSPLLYFNWSATLAIPALAHFSSPSELEPLTPTAPMVSLPTLIGTPPRSAMTSASPRWAASSGISAVRLAHSALVRPKVRAV